MDLRWLSDYLSLLAAGEPWNSSEAYPDKYVQLYPWVVAHPAVFIGLVGAAIFLLAIGARRLFVTGPVHALVTLALLLPAPVAYAVSRVRQQHLFEWYLLFLLPGVIAIVAMGLDAWRASLSRNRIGRGLRASSLVVAIIFGFAAFTQPQRVWLVSHPLQQIRESALATRASLNPADPANRTIVTASFIGPPDPYDAQVLRFTSVKSLADLMAKSDVDKKTLFINFGFIQTASERFPSILKVLRDKSLFEKVAELKGLEPINDRYVYRYKSGSVAGRDLVKEFKPDPQTEMIENRYDTE